VIRQCNAPLRPAESAAVLFGYFKVIELIANTVDLEPPADLEKKQAHFVDKLLTELKSRRILRKKVVAVLDTQKQLARLESRFIGGHDAVARQLGMSHGGDQGTGVMTLHNNSATPAGTSLSLGLNLDDSSQRFCHSPRGLVATHRSQADQFIAKTCHYERTADCFFGVSLNRG
jgi:hypothetical protein